MFSHNLEKKPIKVIQKTGKINYLYKSVNINTFKISSKFKESFFGKVK